MRSVLSQPQVDSLSSFALVFSAMRSLRQSRLAHASCPIRFWSDVAALAPYAQALLHAFEEGVGGLIPFRLFCVLVASSNLELCDFVWPAGQMQESIVSALKPC